MTEPLATPRIVYPDNLPVSARREDIMSAIRENQVVVVAGETGSGKTTQLPKMCLELGLGERGLIGHTQPRRIAARSVAERIAHELGERVGATVGYQVRFTSEVGRDSRIKLMTDGIMLAEISHDPTLSRYNAIIIDEAHERSLNIDFLLGYLRRLLPQRPDLKVVITSATIDPQRFAEHFAQPDPEHPEAEPVPAPVIEVSGRTYPVEIRYRPLTQERSGDGGPDEEDTGDGLADEDRDPIDAVCDAVVELSREPRGDILVFFAGEREIRDAQDALQKVIDSHRSLAGTQILPLFGRLSMAEQNRVFSQSSHRRIVLATNVAETSLTVPGIKYVVDPGTARISRYSARTKVQRLPIERISQASAKQRSGRSGRTSDGVCIRLYSEEDFESRPEFTDPEILRTNLAAVILQMISVGVVREPGDILDFPFVQKPDPRAVKDGVVLLQELGALRGPGASAEHDDAASPPARRSRGGRRGRGRKGGARGPLTRTGEILAALPVDPRLGRMIVEADRRGCAREVLVLTAALTVQDPRERPLEKRQAADEFHARFKDKTSDFLSYGLLWQYLQEQQAELSSSQFRKLCRREYLNFLRIREWQDLYAQLRQIARQSGIDVGGSREIDVAAHQDDVHKSLLSGLLSNIGVRDERSREYRGARGTRFAIFPGSALFKKSPDWIVSAELVETSRLWARTNAAIQPEWAEEIAPSLVKRSYSEPHWSRSRGAVMASEKVTLYGLPLVSERPVLFSSIDPELSRELFIRHALVEGDWQTRHTFVKRNRKALAEVEELENRMRRKDLRVDDQVLFDFYDARVPANVVSQRHFDAWWKKARHQDEHLLDLTPEDLIAPEAPALDTDSFPRSWHVHSPEGDLSLDLDYEFAPGTDTADGVTVRIPVLFLDRLAPEQFEWHIPGLRVELVTALIKSLPKAVRRNFVPAPDTAAAAVRRLDEEFDPPSGSLLEALATVLRRMRGHPVQASDFHPETLPPHLRMRFEVRDARSAVLGRGDDLTELKQRLRPRVREALAQSLGQAAAQLYDAAGTSASAASGGDDDAAPGSRRGRRSGRDDRKGRGSARPDERAASSASLERTDLRAWPEPDPPRSVETTVAGQTVTGYPTLVAVAPEKPGSTEPPRVDLRILSDPEEQRAAQRDGVIALLQRVLPSVHRYVVDHLSQRERLIFTQNPHGSVEALIHDCTGAAIDRLVPHDPPFTRAEFDRLAEHVRAELIDTVFDVTALVTTALTEATTVRKRLKKPGSLGAVPAFTDMAEQVDRLIHPGFVARTGWQALQHLPRYLAGVNARLDKLSGHLQRDAVAMQTVHELEAAYRAALDTVPPTVPTPAALREIRWDLEELRVSFFAQELGTAHTVSEKRLRKKLRELG